MTEESWGLLFCEVGLYYRPINKMATPTRVRKVRFGDFVVDLHSGEIHKHGIRLKLQDQPFQILASLLENPGELVTREQLRKKLWSDDTFVDFDAGLNAAIRKLRDVLSESAANPRYIETLTRHGYRFVATVEAVPDAKLAEVEVFSHESIQRIHSQAQVATPFNKAGGNQRTAGLVRYGRGWIWVSVVLAVTVILIAGTVWTRHSRFFSTQAASGIRSVAVLPLQNLSDDPSQEYFSDGMTDALITNLAQIKSLRVISRTSSMQFKGSKKSLPEIGRELGVDALIEGTVLRDGKHIRIDAQLIRADGDRHIWAQSYQRNLDDVVALQAEVATRVATEIAASITPQEKARLTRTSTSSPEAYEDYLKGGYFYSKQTDEGFTKSIEYYQKAVDIDPDFAPAYLGLAETYAFIAYTQRAEPSETWGKSEKFVTRALKLDPDSSGAHALSGMIQLKYHCNHQEAENQLQKALELNPGDMGAVDYHSYFLLGAGRYAEAIAEKKRVLEHDPVSVVTSAELGEYFVEARRYGEAIQQLHKTLELDANFVPGLTRLGYAYAGRKEYEQAVAVLQKAIALDKAPGKLGFLGDVYAQWGKTHESLQVIDELQQMTTQRYVPPELFARIYARLGEKEKAFAYLAKTNKADPPALSNSAFDSLRADPRYKYFEARLIPTGECESF